METKSREFSLSADQAPAGWHWLRRKPSPADGKMAGASPDIETDVLDHFQHHAPPLVLMINVVLATSLVAVMWRWENPVPLVIWWFVQSAITLGNGLLYRAFRQTRAHGKFKPNAYWYRWFCTGALINGLSWGTATSLFYSPAVPLQSTFVILITAGIAAGAASIQTALRIGFLGFISPALLLPAMVIPLRFGEDELTPAALLAFYFCCIAYIGFNNRRTVIETIRLKFEKDQLLRLVKSNERYFRALIENASDVVLVVDEQGTIVFQSPSSRHVLGLRPEELTGQCFFDFIHTDDVHGMRSTLQYLRKYPGVMTGGEARWQHRHGRWLVMEGNGRTLDIDTNLVVINARDVTERRAMENELREAKARAETASQTKSLFLASMSHEIRTPMHAILAMAEVLGESPLSAVQQRHVAAFKAAGEQLLGLLNDLLDFSRIEAGELKLAKVPFHLPRLVETICDLMWSQANNKQIALHRDIDMTVRPWRLGDPQRLRQILVNLLSNAIKFTCRGGVTVCLRGGDSDQVILSVSDTGEGIPEEQHGTIFDSFSQGDTRVGERFGGAGLGLAICKRLVQAMAGEIRVQSKPGEGSTFTCVLALKVTDAPVEGPVATPQGGAGAMVGLPKATILVADDSAMNRMVIEEYLQGTDCTVDCVANGREAVMQSMSRPYDLILMDLRMPVLDGLAATRLIRAYQQAQHKPAVPVIALTAGILNNEREAALDAGCNDFLAKPVSKEELVRVLVKFLVCP